MYQTFTPSNRLRKSVKEIKGFDIDLLLKRLDEIKVHRFQTVPRRCPAYKGSGSAQMSSQQTCSGKHPQE